MDQVVETKGAIHDIRSRPDWVYYPNQDILRSYWERDIKGGFGMVNSIQSKNPKILELKKYSEGIDEKLQFLRKPVGMGHQEAELLMSKIPQKITMRVLTQQFYGCREKQNILRNLKMWVLAVHF